MSTFVVTIVLPLLTVVLSLTAERLLTARHAKPGQSAKPTRRLLAKACALHIAILLSLYGLNLAVTQRPGLASALTLFTVVLLLLVNVDKARALKEPFLACDFVYFWDVIKHPRLYLPYFGYAKAALLAIGFVVLVGTWWLLEAGLSLPASLSLGGGALVVCGYIAWRLATHLAHEITLNPVQDLDRLGLLAMLAAYRANAASSQFSTKETLQRSRPFASIEEALTQRVLHQAPATSAKAPVLLCLQVESFADIRRTYPDQARHLSLPNWDGLTAKAWTSGLLTVPGFGANTVRTEFEFLMGMPVAALGVHGFEPYQFIARHLPGQTLASLPAALRHNGFLTRFIHPYHGSFYQRERVLPVLGFDEFVDIKRFEAKVDVNREASWNGYISDAVMGQVMVEQVQTLANEQPAFLYGVTMQGHGPYVKGAGPHSPEALFEGYLDRLRATDHMLGVISNALEAIDRPVVLCVFGDHVPILTEAYDAWGWPDGKTDYLIWRHGDQRTSGQTRDCASHELAKRLWQASAMGNVHV